VEGTQTHVTPAQVVAFARAVEERAEELLRDLHALVLLARQMQEQHAPKEPEWDQQTSTRT
jgi:hypothetical protein